MEHLQTFSAVAMGLLIYLSLFITTAVAVSIDACPGYSASNVEETTNGLTADLTLLGEPCNVYGIDAPELKLVVEYQTDKRLHVKIYDAGEKVYQIPESIIPRPSKSGKKIEQSDLVFDLKAEPFSFTVSRRDSKEVLFDTSAEKLIFESQYVRLRTNLPKDPNIYGLGEHSDSFRLPTNSSYRRTMWNREAIVIPQNTNLYGSHPMYLEHRKSGSHGVLLMNSNGMDIDLNITPEGDHYLEYNTIGGILDFYFFAGPTPTEVSKQHAEAIGLAAMMPYWSLGFHQAKYGYWDVNVLAEVVANYSTANIPLEVLWSDIDYMDMRKDFTTDPERFPMSKMRELVDTLHNRQQQLVMMLDPGISTNSSYESFQRGQEAGAFLKAADGSNYRGVQWAGEVVWPDYHSKEGHDWWVDEMERFFDPETGLDIDGVWNDMNEASNFCPNVDCDPAKHAKDTNTPPQPPENHRPRPNTGRPIPGFPDSFQPNSTLAKRQDASSEWEKALAHRDLFNPPYSIQNAMGRLSDRTIYTNISNHDGTAQYDTHNLYGLTMVKATYDGMIKRKPGKRPFVLTRSTFLHSSAWSAHWFGDNRSSWAHYRISIAQMLGFTAVHNYPMVGSDVCGFNGRAEENMCSRWVLLGAFMPFFRNHADVASTNQEFYLWESVTKVAQKAIDARYRLLDYIYTALHHASSTGVPSVNPLFFIYTSDSNTFGIDTQFFLGDSLLVSPVVEDDSQSVTFYLPDDLFYDFWTHKPIRGQGEHVTVDNVGFDEIPVYIRGGSIVPLRNESANTTAELRKKNFNLVVAQDENGYAEGSLYLDDGESIEGKSSEIKFVLEDNILTANGTFGYRSSLEVESITILSEKGSGTISLKESLDRPFEVQTKIERRIVDQQGSLP
ncbi:putative alpha/beta-glucosidase agdC [Fusarium keratoplasticum]|uniref:Alpha/beta-glucosidase agdC n=1 Tax=Fusarium keratoplasticum TaxID=1328300 RepID=A0ACC0QTD5_9HYPO|nr:putative alpha/beta-glucosidase agdC [Fusarium keratoplasticum]KAI8665959.1 putative alpha/beta-glucosidase agdC [Fusarium keratoplasticum]